MRNNFLDKKLQVIFFSSIQLSRIVRLPTWNGFFQNQMKTDIIFAKKTHKKIAQYVYTCDSKSSAIPLSNQEWLNYQCFKFTMAIECIATDHDSNINNHIIEAYEENLWEL